MRIPRRLSTAVAGALVLAVTLLLAGAASAQTSGGLYRFTDERGVVHFTNLPSDDRYRKVGPPARRASWGGPDAYDYVIERAARVYGVPAAMVKAVVAAESAFDPLAVSPKGAMGLMQLMPATARHLGVSKPFRASENVHGGTRYLRRLHDRFGSWTHTLAAYNAGPTAVDRYRGVPPYPETRKYVKKVLSYYRRFHGDFPR